MNKYIVVRHKKGIRTVFVVNASCKEEAEQELGKGSVARLVKNICKHGDS